ncbi:MAG: putative cupredoxin-like copper-binding protein [Polaribacter sp.]|jgi:uncharacterized cupredoxin-like copper-binding protein
MKVKLIIATIITMAIYSNFSMAGGKHKHAHDSEGSSVGAPAGASKASRTIKVTTKDSMRYEFSSELNLKAGEVIKFVVTNVGIIDHEFSVGDAKEQESHQAMMLKMPNMVHEDGNTVTVKPGETKELTWKFSADADVVFACNIPGHFQSGMFKKVTVKGPADESQTSSRDNKAKKHKH